MKNLLIIISFFFLQNLTGQVTVFQENNFRGMNTIGLEYKSEKGFGVYVNTGTNLLEKALGFDNKTIYKTDGNFTSTVNWYTKNGTYYEQAPPTQMFTTKEWGNRLLETGTCVNTVERWETKKVVSKCVVNVGVVFPIKNTRFRLGGGVYNQQEIGTTKHDYWSNQFSVSKYYDEWGVIAQPSGVFVVVGNGKVNEYTEEVPVNLYVLKLNVNFAVEFPINDKGQFSLGYDSNGGINIGFGFNIN
jgi:hypothetical protein